MVVTIFFNKNKQQTGDVYTPQREDKNAGRKKIAWIVLGVLALVFVGWQMFKPNGVPGGSMMTRVDKSGQTAGASMYTPREQQEILQAVLEEDGEIDPSSESYFQGVPETVETGLQYILDNLGQSDNPGIKGVDTEDMLTRMQEEPGGWENEFYSAPTVFELLQLFNFTQPENMSDQERQELEQQGTAVANPEESYELIGNGVTVEDTTQEGSPYYTADVTVEYQSEQSLPVTIQFGVSVSNNNRIFDITPIGITTQQPGGE